MGGFDGGGPFIFTTGGDWRFDDCIAERTDLSDRSFGHTAFRSVSVGCVAGIQGSAVEIDDSEDYVYVPDQPDFTFDNGLTVAAWVKPAHLGGVRTIFRKREGGTSTFVLLSNGRDYELVIRLDNGRAASVKARATLDTWTHVAGTYDGRELRLYLNGILSTSRTVVGRLSSGQGPLLVGNDAYGRRMDGDLDNLFFRTAAATPDEVTHLTCLARPSTLVAVPSSSPPVPAGTEVTYDVQIQNNSCDDTFLQFEASSPDQGLLLTPSFQFAQLAAGEISRFPLTVSSTPDLEVDDHVISLRVFLFSQDFENIDTTVTYSVQGGPCDVRTRRELMITDLSVVEDPVRTAPGGAWTFGKLMEDMAPTPADAPAMVEKVLRTWLTDQTVNGQIIPARPAMDSLVLSSFPRTPDGGLDLGRAPVRLLAIVNRVDLRDLSKGNAGEGRFVFGVLDPIGFSQQFTIILEYKVPASTEADVIGWAQAWHALGTLPRPSEAYNSALQGLTDRFAGRNAAPGGVNGSSLATFRTNEIAISNDGVWQLREFHLSRETGMLEPAPVDLTPNRDFNGTSILADYINANAAAIVAEKHVVPEIFAGQAFLGGSILNDGFTGWNAPGIANPEARQKFSINTCNGCHAVSETNTLFLMVNPRDPGQESFLSAFLTGTQVVDRQAGVIRAFNELRRRNRDLHLLNCPNDPLPPEPPPVPFPGGLGGRGVPPGGIPGGGAGGATGSGGGLAGGSPSGGPTVPAPGTAPGNPPGLAAQAASQAQAEQSFPVVDESKVVVRPDFVAKGINRAD